MADLVPIRGLDDGIFYREYWIRDEALPCHVILEESFNMQAIYLTLEDPYRMTWEVVLLQAGRCRRCGMTGSMLVKSWMI